MSKIVTLGQTEQVRYYKLDGKLFTFSGQELDPEELKQFVGNSRSKFFLVPLHKAAYYLMPKDFAKAMEKATVQAKFNQDGSINILRLDGQYRGKHYVTALYPGSVCLVLTVVDQGEHHTVPLDLESSSEEVIQEIYKILKLTR